ncbi:GGDEF domain-containing protein [Methyloterricola oryzae]|uniref:GGDEF domain-containing protein n=1 Tax=Methyloterricola oryzae TaxID=1495050 RepID=UPI0011AFB5F2|nr:GGDEF domain-containing protein [Methyloterricola oryzae]
MNKAMQQLASLTAVRDFELLEMGLLKSLEEMLKLRSIKLLTLSEQNGSYEIRGYERDAEGVSRACHVTGLLSPLPQGISPSVWGAIEQAKATRRRVALIGEENFGTVYPLLANDMILGYVLIAEGSQPNSLEYQLVEGVLRVFHNYYALLEESQRDKLTGLLNRKTFDDKIGRVLDMMAVELSSSFHGSDRRKRQEFGPPSWLAVMDIDHFKRVNDSFGHIYGDEVLILVSQIMKRSFRADDLLFRFGGEEFVAIISAHDRAGAKAAFERFRSAVEHHPFPQVGRVTMSIGVAGLERIGNPTLLLGNADKALYHAKRNGRNRLVFYEELVADGTVQETSVSPGSVDLF